ncbi:MAG TPA: M23 family metallopeptidase [Burkholderiales bacterium]|nr:M23 family metallopeptidase [Burkholderiales bacterium]
MTTLDSRAPRSKRPLLLGLLLVIAAVLIAGGLHFAPRFEKQAPVVTLTPDSEMIGKAPIEIGVTDKGTGLRSITATLTAGGTEHPIATEIFADPALEKKITIEVAKLKGIKEGPAVLRVVARDGSLFTGNETVLQKELTIDVTPPTIQLVAEDRYINFGGAGALVYKPSADTATSGVRVGNHFFPGHKGQVKGQEDHYVVLFAHPYDAPSNAKAFLVATDRAGNTREMAVSYELKGVKYRKSTLAITDGFIETKVAPLVKGDPPQGPKEVFLAVNNQLRKENDDRITAITKKSTSEKQWEGAFVQLSNSKVEANFADERTYTYNGEPIDKAYHLGYDLSVTKRYPVEAANHGTVVFAGDMGIYGNTVILDHGLGLFTLYSHLSSMDAKEGDKVKQRGILGRTGETGLAAGDHLHYGVYLHGVAVLPVEWWDPKWIKDNIEPKLQGMSGDEIAEMQEPKRAVQKRRR